VSEFSWEEVAKRYASNADFWRRKFEALEAELAALREQEPVAWALRSAVVAGIRSAPGCPDITGYGDNSLVDALQLAFGAAFKGAPVQQENNNGN
jgi:hypothetical protein